jgi:hypothetical protein
VAKVEPLSTTEEEFWRALMRIVLSLPRRLDSDLVRTVGVTANEYTTLMCLSEAPGRELRMADLANAAALSPSRLADASGQRPDPGVRPCRPGHRDEGRAGLVGSRCPTRERALTSETGDPPTGPRLPQEIACQSK